MKGTKELKTNKGITLIALVITIIVMLILVAVTITMAVNGGLFDYASSAGTKTNSAKDAEQEFANLQPDMTYDQLIDKYTGWTGDENNGESVVCEDCEEGWIFPGTYGPNPDRCSKCWITFTVFNSTYYAYSALKEITWGEFIEKDENYSFRVNGEYIYKSGGYEIVHYEDGTRVKPTDKIQARIYLY